MTYDLPSAIALIKEVTPADNHWVAADFAEDDTPTTPVDAAIATILNAVASEGLGTHTPQTRNEQHNLRLYRAILQIAARIQLKGYVTDTDLWFSSRSDRETYSYVYARVRYISPDLNPSEHENWESANLPHTLTDPGFSADEFAASFESYITSTIEPIVPASEAAIGNIMKLVEKLQTQAEAAGLPPIILNPIAAMAETLRTNIITHKR